MSSRLEKDLLAVTRQEAAGVLESAGLKVEVLYTGIPGGPDCAGERVVRFRLSGSTGIITVAREMTSFSGDRKSFSETGGLKK